MDMDTREIVFIRHGETQRNKMGLGVLCGRADSPLTQDGEKKAAVLAQDSTLSDVQKVISSNLGRALTTARLAFPGRKIEETENLAERSLGNLEGMREEDVYKQYGYTKSELQARRHDYLMKAPKGESYSDVIERGSKIVEYVETEDIKKAAFVTHGVMMKALIPFLCGMDPDVAFDLQMPHCEPIVLVRNKGSKIYKLKSPTWDKLIKRKTN